MRVAVILPAESAGAVAGSGVDALVAGLVARGDTVSVFGPEADDGPEGVRVVQLELPPSAGPRDVGAITALRRALRDEPVDVVHAFGLRAGFVAGMARPAPAKLVVSWYGELAPGGMRRTATLALARLVVAETDVMLYTWPELADAARRLDTDVLRRGRVLAPDLPSPQRGRKQVREEFGLAPDVPLVVSGGRLDPHHHYEILIAAAARWRELHPRPVVLIAGTGPAYRGLAAQAVVARSPVLLVGEREDMADLLGAADVVVTGETTPLFTREALAAGSALVAPDVGAVPELVGVGAVLVKHDDVDALDAAVRALLDDPHRRTELGRAGRARAATWATPEEAVAQIRTTYAELLAADVADADE
jgi:glycosyltransferase involved in cell wall biosynthesis